MTQLIDHGAYEVIFDLAAQHYEPPLMPVVIGTVFAFASVLSVLRAPTLLRRVLSMVLGAILASLCAYLVYVHYQEYTRLRTALLLGDVGVVSGPVRNFQADSAIGNGAQTFSVLGIEFVLRSHQITAAFNDTVGSGGPNLIGRCVRVAFVREGDETLKIVWLGVLKTECEPQSGSPIAG